LGGFSHIAISSWKGLQGGGTYDCAMPDCDITIDRRRVIAIGSGTNIAISEEEGRLEISQSVKDVAICDISGRG